MLLTDLAQGMKTTSQASVKEGIMKAVRIHTYSGPEALVYENAPRPEIADDQVLVQIYATSVNSVDRFTRAGYLQGMVDFPLPMTLGLDLSGVVTAIGKDVTTLAVGDAVYGYSNMLRQGAYAEYAAVSATEVAPKPNTIDHSTAAAIPLAGLAAWQALAAAGLQAGQSILIHGAGGGVGTFAVQFAREQRARVLGTASSDKVAFLHELGVAEAIDYTTTRFEDVARDVDVVLDTVGGEVMERSWAVLRPGGTLVTLAGQPDQAMAAARGVRGLGQMTQARLADLTEIAALVDAGRVKPIVSTVLPLAEARAAHELLERGHTRGKIVLRVVEE
jgi:NADPH:quinone reductase-like Zn-dependent oxidoreductase